jgi:hypothetical protein
VEIWIPVTFSALIIIATIGLEVDNKRSVSDKIVHHLLLLVMCGGLWVTWGNHEGRRKAFKDLGFKEVTKTVTLVEKAPAEGK